MVRMDTKLSTEEHVMNGTRHTGTSVAVYKDLKEQILHLELPPGSAISEIDTAAAFRCGMPLKCLSARGFWKSARTSVHSSP